MAMNVGEINESEFVSLNLPENGSAGVLSSGSSSQMSVPLASTSSTGLDFLPTNYELNKSSSPGDTTSLNFGDEPQLRHRGAVGGYMDKYGMGWLLDQNTNDIDDEDSLPLLQELDIDVKEIHYKLKCVIMPMSNETLNRSILRDNPDFWGPLLIVLAFASLSVYGQFKVVSWIITIWIIGSFLIFVIARVLGGEVNYSQIVGTIGYSLLPLCFMSCGLFFFKHYHHVCNLIKIICVIWSTYSAATLLCVQELQHKKPLLLYPIFLLYIYFLSLYSGV